MMIKLLVASLTISLAACGGASNTGGSSPSAKAQKGAGQKGTAAKDSGQKVGGHAGHDRSKGQDKGATYEDLACDDSLEGLAWCDSDTELAFCSSGQWWVLDCSHPDIDGDFCAESGSTVDCYAEAEI
jgi:hypothetical protein